MSISTGALRKFPAPFLVETGTYEGAGIYQALASNAFPHIFSIELSDLACMNARHRFMARRNVTILFGHSPIQIMATLQRIPGPLTFALDAHYSGPPTVKGPVGELNPIMEELDAIASYPITTHNFLIDDVRLFGTDEFAGITEAMVRERILKMNAGYKFRYENNTDGKPDVLAAFV